MSIWFVLWFVLSAALLGFLGWTYFILYKQKRAWKGFAQHKNWRYRGNGMFSSPELVGEINGYSVNLFTGEYIAPDMRRARKLTAIEVMLSSSLPMDGALANGDLVKMIQELGFKDELHPEHEGWDQSYIAASDDNDILRAYLTSERLSALTSMMKMKNVWVILIFRDDALLLRLDTPAPLASEKELNDYVQKITQTAKICELKDGELLKFKEHKNKKEAGNIVLENAEEIEGADLQLEEDDHDDEAES